MSPITTLDHVPLVAEILHQDVENSGSVLECPSAVWRPVRPAEARQAWNNDVKRLRISIFGVREWSPYLTEFPA